MITRIRIEATARTGQELQDDLIGAGALVRETYGGEWQPQWGDVQTTKDGYWRYLVMVRVP